MLLPAGGHPAKEAQFPVEVKLGKLPDGVGAGLKGISLSHRIQSLKRMFFFCSNNLF
jgi:hypothetical protein